MKFRIEIDCTPLEARKFLGLPDVEPMQEALMAQAQAQMSKAMAVMDPEAVMRQWLPLSVQGIDQLQKFMFSAAQAAMDRGKTRPKTPSEEPEKSV